jgi:hypothetical protein
MKKATLISLFALAALTIGTRSAGAQATKIDVDMCNILLSDCSSFAVVPDMMILQANNPDGSWMTRCVSELPEGAEHPKSTVRCNEVNSGQVCETLFGDTTDWSETITPAGKVILICHGAAASSPTP